MQAPFDGVPACVIYLYVQLLALSRSLEVVLCKDTIFSAES
jgi:hypothetical protein